MNDVIRRLRRLRRGSLYLLTCDRGSRKWNLHRLHPVRIRPSRRWILDIPSADPLENSPSSFVFAATSRELLWTGTFVIGSDDRSSFLDNSPFTLKAKGKWLCGVTVNRTLDVAGFSLQGLNKLMRSICDSYFNKYRVNVTTLTDLWAKLTTRVIRQLINDYVCLLAFSQRTHYFSIIIK